MTGGNQIPDKGDPELRARSALKKLVYTAACTRGLGDEIVDMYADMDQQIHPFLKECAEDAGMTPVVFHAYGKMRLQGPNKPFNDIQLTCIGDKLHHWLDPDYKPQGLLELERDLERELARFGSSELVGA